MSYSLTDYFRLVSPYISDVLVDPQQLSLIQKVAELLPPISPVLLECRLEAGQPQVDLSVGLRPMKLPIRQSLLSYPFWQQVQSFCQDWTRVNSLPYDTVEDMWLEFDLDGAEDNLIQGSWFLSLRTEVFQDKNAGALSKFREIVSYATGAQMDTRLGLVDQCINALPQGAGINQIGAMRSRLGEPLRLNVSGLSTQAIPGYLAEIQSEPVTADLAEIINLIGHLSDRLVLCFDVEEKIGSRIGLECYLDKQPKKEPRWAEFLDVLVGMKCCTREKRDHLLEWPGLIHQKDSPELWPMNLRQMNSLITPGTASVFWRTINHLKLVYQPGRYLESKAYLAFGHRWFNSTQ